MNRLLVSVDTVKEAWSYHGKELHLPALAPAIFNALKQHHT